MRWQVASVFPSTYLLKSGVNLSMIATPAGGRKNIGVAMTMRVSAVVRIALRAAKCETPALDPSSLYTSTPSKREEF